LSVPVKLHAGTFKLPVSLVLLIRLLWIVFVQSCPILYHEMAESDLALALALQAQFDEEDAHEEVSSFIPEEFRFGSPAGKKRKIDPSHETSIIAPEWEDLDPTPGILFKELFPIIHRYWKVNLRSF